MTLVGSTIRNIRLVDELGEGGMGQVYVGLDEKLGRKVAVKAIRSDRRLEAGARARFLREAQILSQLEHPNICRVYDFVEEDGDEYLVLELVQGRNLRAIIADGPSQAQRLRIADQIVRALVAAHSMSVVHRDLKPANIMITDEGVVKVLDFGLARSVSVADTASGEDGPAQPAGGLEPDWSGAETLTELGHVMGTPRYMSPEQARGEPLTAASDMYSLGLVLQELFTGRSPYEGERNAAQLVQRAMWGDTDKVENVDRQLAGLIEELKVLTPGERPNAVTAEQRLGWIRDRPKRRARRLAAAVVVISLVLAAAGSTFGLLHARRSLAEAERARGEAEAVSGFLGGLLASAQPARMGRDVKVVDVLATAAERVSEDFANQPFHEAAIRHTLGTTHKALGDYDAARLQLEAAVELKRTHLGAEHDSTLLSLNNLANVIRSQGDYGGAETLHREVLEARRRTLGERHEDTLASLHNLGTGVLRQGRYEESADMLRQAWELRRETLGEEHRDTLASMGNLAANLRAMGQLEESADLQRQCLEIRRRALGEDHPDTLASLGSLANVLMSLGRLDEAEELLRQTVEGRARVFGEEHPNTLIARGNLAAAMNRGGRPEEAEQLLRETLSVSTRVQGEDHPYTLVVLTSLGDALYKQQRYAEAEAVVRESLIRREAVVGADHPWTVESMNLLANILGVQGKFEEAERLYREVLQRTRAARGDDHPETLEASESLAALLRHLGRDQEADELAPEPTPVTPESG